MYGFQVLKRLKGSGNLVDGVSGATPLGDLASFTQDQPAYSSLG